VNDSLAPFKALARSALVLRLAAMGAVSGVAAWALALLLGSLGGRPPAEPDLLASAVLKGIVVGSVFGLLLHAWWHRDELP
jgi:hypothetical protein